MMSARLLGSWIQEKPINLCVIYRTEKRGEGGGRGRGGQARTAAGSSSAAPEPHRAAAVPNIQHRASVLMVFLRFFVCTQNMGERCLLFFRSFFFNVYCRNSSPIEMREGPWSELVSLSLPCSRRELLDLSHRSKVQSQAEVSRN